MKKIIRNLVLTMVLACVGFISNVSAAPSSIVVNSSGRLDYIGYTYFTKKFTSNGSVAYCLDFYKPTPMNTTMWQSGNGDAGLTYIIRNGYPNKSITGDGNLDTFVTASAIWWYLDDTQGTSNLTHIFKTTGSDPHGLRSRIQALVNGAKSARDNTGSLSASVASKAMTLSSDKKYFDSNLINVASSGISTYNVALTNAPSGTIITDESGNAKSSFAAGSKFKVRVPVASLGKNLSANVNVNITSSFQTYKTFKYTDGGNYQPVITTTVEEQTNNLAAKIDLNLISSRIKISKLDVTNKKELPGAKLTIKDNKGNVIDSWTSTKDPHYISYLPEGVYTLEEEIAPEGYILNKEKVTFTVTAKGIEQTVIMYNEPKKKPVPTPTPTPEEVIEVPKTASSIPMIIYILGFTALAGGSGLVYYNAKLKKQ